MKHSPCWDETSASELLFFEKSRNFSRLLMKRPKKVLSCGLECTFVSSCNFQPFHVINFTVIVI